MEGRNPKEHEMNTLTKVAALAAVLSATAAFAQDYPSTASSETGAQSVDYAKLDKNGDGNISKEEAKADPSLSAKFDALDTDKSGSLCTTELRAKMKDK
jgi:Ca2+-binding EF-hand superfamily protein